MCSYAPALRALALLLIASIAAPFVYAQEAPRRVVLPRVGNLIDAEEIAYFGLFHRYAGVEEARVYHTPGDSLFNAVLQWSTPEGLQDSVVVLTTPEFEAVHFYLDRFEEVYEQKVQADWRRLGRLARPRWLNPSVPEVVLETREGKRLRGRLLYGEALFVLLWEGEGFYDWRTAGQHTRLVPYSDVERIVLSRPLDDVLNNRVLSEAGAVVGAAALTGEVLRAYTDGFEAERMRYVTVRTAAAALAFWQGTRLVPLYKPWLIGGSAEALGNRRRGLRRHAFFHRTLPPELRGMVTQARATLADDRTPPPRRWRRTRLVPGRLHFLVAHTFEQAEEGEPFTAQIGGTRFTHRGLEHTVQEKTYPSGRVPQAFTADLSYSVRTAWRVGAQWAEQEALPSVQERAVEYVRTHAGALYAEYVLALGPAETWRRLEVAGGMGVLRRTTEADWATHVLVHPRLGGPSVLPLENRVRTSTYGPYFRLTLDYYIASRVSVHVRATQDFARAAEAPGHQTTLTYEGQELTIVAMAPHALTVPRRHLAAGLKWHIGW